MWNAELRTQLDVDGLKQAFELIGWDEQLGSSGATPSIRAVEEVPGPEAPLGEAYNRPAIPVGVYLQVPGSASMELLRLEEWRDLHQQLARGEIAGRETLPDLP